MMDFLKALTGGVLALAAFYIVIWAMALAGPVAGMALR